MSSFVSLLHQIMPDDRPSGESRQGQQQQEQHNNPHAVPNPFDLSGVYRLVQDQMGTLATTAPDDGNRSFLVSLVEALELDIANPPVEIPGVSQEFLDMLDRVPRKTIKPDDTCPICAEKYLDDQYCLVVELPCHHSHKFDLECVGPWLRSKGTCPLCRMEMVKKKEVAVEEDEEEDDMDGLYA